MRSDFIKQAKLKAANFCSYQERTQQEARDKLYALGLHRDEVESTISELITENFINEERFARTFAGGKFRLKKWGNVKIKLALKQKKLTDYCIQKGLEEIDKAEYLQVLKQLAEKKISALTGIDPYVAKNKTARYLITKGYEADLVWETVNDLFLA